MYSVSCPEFAKEPGNCARTCVSQGDTGDRDQVFFFVSYVGTPLVHKGNQLKNREDCKKDGPSGGKPHPAKESTNMDRDQETWP